MHASNLASDSSRDSDGLSYPGGGPGGGHTDDLPNCNGHAIPRARAAGAEE